MADGTAIEGWVIPPVGHRPGAARSGTRHPLVLNIHGGPHSAYRNAFSPMFHVLSGSGFYVFYVNPRGSTGYGNDFKHGIHGGWGLIDEEDFVTGIEAVLAAYPDVDPGRLGVTGGSYGGYMTNWLTARTDLFAAAVTRASISNWESLAKTTDSTLPHRPSDGASFEQREAYRAMSPISYVENVRTPTLVVHGEHDFRTPLGEGEQWYQALTKLGVPTESNARTGRASSGSSATVPEDLSPWSGFTPLPASRPSPRRRLASSTGSPSPICTVATSFVSRP